MMHRILTLPKSFNLSSLGTSSSCSSRSSSSGTSNRTVDTLIIGGGPIGLSSAYHLATHYRNNDGSSITIVERDPTYAQSSATLSAGGIRQQVRRGMGYTKTYIASIICTHGCEFS